MGDNSYDGPRWTELMARPKWPAECERWGTMLGSGGPLSFKPYPSEKSDGRNQATLILIDNSDSERLVEPIDGPGIHRMWL